MEKIRNLVNENKDYIIAILALVVSFCTALLSMGGKTAIFATVMIAIIELLIFYLKNGLSEKFMELCVSTAKLIVDVINGEYTKTKTITVYVEEDPKVASASASPKKKRVRICYLTEEMIRDILEKKDKGEENAEV